VNLINRGRNGVTFTREGRILIITLDDPPENKVTHELFLEFNTHRSLLASPDIDLVIFTGQGNIFSKGFDLQSIDENISPQVLGEQLTFMNEMYAFIESLDKPVLAAMNGHCLGGGLELALTCHMRLCSDKARLGLPEVSIGIIPGLGGIHRLARVVGQSKALEMITFGDVIPASEALRINLVNRLLPREGFMSHVMRLARTLLMANQNHVREVIRLLRQAEMNNDQQNIRAAVESFVHIFRKQVT